MTPSKHFPGPRDGLDEGSVTELVADGQDIEIEVEAPRPWVASTSGPIDVPADASALIDGLPSYGG